MATARVVLGDPQKIGESAIGAYVSYKLSAELSTKVQGLDSLTYTVIRRFSDFFWLRTQLRDAFPFLIVPALPEKQQMGRFNQEFVDVRMRALQRWVDRIAANPLLVSTAAFRHFISMPAEPFTALREGSRSDQMKDVAVAGKKQVMRVLKTATVIVKDAIAQARGNAPSSASPASTASSRTVEDASFRDLEMYLLGQAPLITALYNSSAALALRARELAQLLLDLGAAMRALGQTETGALGESLNSVGLASWASSTAAYEAAVCDTEALVERLADYVRLTRAVRETLDTRSRASADLADAITTVERLRSLVASLSMSTTPSAAKDKYSAEADLNEAQKAAAEARTQYDAGAAAVIMEVDKLRGSMVIDFRGMLLDFVNTQLKTELKLAGAWEKVATTQQPALGSPLGGGRSAF